MYKDKYGITTIRHRDNGDRNPRHPEMTAYDQVSMSYELEEKMAVMLYVPHLDYDDHDHVPLSRDNCVKLRDWLNEFLEDERFK